MDKLDVENSQFIDCFATNGCLKDDAASKDHAQGASAGGGQTVAAPDKPSEIAKNRQPPRFLASGVA